MSEGLFMFTPPDADAEVRFATIGSPISPLDEVLVLAPGTDAEVAEGEPGELCARGPYTIRGYLAAPERNREAFTAAGYYRSGDLVRAHRTPHGVAYSVEGRIKDLIDRGGEKINAEEVESLLVQHPGVAEAGLVAMPDPRLGERGCVYVVPRDPATPPDLAGLCRYLEERGLAKYKWPERLELVDALPRTPVGKLAKNALRADITAKLAADSGR
jgi:2,3-dihydroxybenzoate-AMP ligase